MIKEHLVYRLDNKGYQPSTTKEILENLTQDVQKEIPDFQLLPQELRGNLLIEGSVFEIYVENLLTAMFNFASPSLANETFFEFFANERGLRRKRAYKSEVDLQFTGDPGSLIPKELEVTNQDASIVYKIAEEHFIGKTGTINVLAYSDADTIPQVNIGDLNRLVLNLPLQVTNTSTPTQPQDEEDFEEFKSACQARWRNPKNASFEGLLTALSRIEGVDKRSITYSLKEVQDQAKTYEAINLVIGGGDPLEIAKVIYKNGGLIAKKYLSAPSKNETQRTISQNLIIYGNTHTYQFTRPKQINLNLKVIVSFVKISTSSESVKQMTKETMQEFINHLQVGSKINKASLSSVFLKGIERAGAKPSDLKGDLQFEAKDGITPINFDSQGFLETDFDWLFVLTGYDVQVNA